MARHFISGLLHPNLVGELEFWWWAKTGLLGPKKKVGVDFVMS